MVRRLLIVSSLVVLVLPAQAQKRSPLLQVAPAGEQTAKSTRLLAAPQNLVLAVDGATVSLSWDEPPAPAAERTELEPNNLLTAPQLLFGPAPISLAGDAAVSDSGQVSVTFIDNTEDDFEDLFVIELLSPGGEITLEEFSVDCDLYLLSEETGTLQIVGESIDLGLTPERISLGGRTPGRYLIGVSIFDPGQPALSSDYRLSVTGDISVEAVAGYRVYRSTNAGAAVTGAVVADLVGETRQTSDTVPAAGTYYYQVTAMGTAGESAPSNEVSSAVSTAVEHEVPHKVALDQNWPNPFNPSTRITFTVERPGPVRLEVLDLLGRLVDVPIQSWLRNGRHEFTWYPEGLPTGSYIYRISQQGRSVSRVMTYLR